MSIEQRESITAYFASGEKIDSSAFAQWLTIDAIAAMIPEGAQRRRLLELAPLAPYEEYLKSRYSDFSDMADYIITKSDPKIVGTYNDFVKKANRTLIDLQKRWKTADSAQLKKLLQYCDEIRKLLIVPEKSTLFDAPPFEEVIKNTSQDFRDYSDAVLSQKALDDVILDPFLAMIQKISASPDQGLQWSKVVKPILHYETMLLYHYGDRYKAAYILMKSSERAVDLYDFCVDIFNTQLPMIIESRSLKILQAFYAEFSRLANQ